MERDELIVVCAVRYALGRMTYIVAEVCDYVASKKDSLSQQCINSIISDVEENLEMCRKMGRTLGMECDEQRWVRLLDDLKQYKEQQT